MSGAAFERAIADPRCGAAYDFESDSPALLIAFGGLRGNLGGIAPFEFFRSASRLPVKRIYVRDLHQAWYHRGIEATPTGLDQARAKLAALVERAGAQRTVTIGNSAGGYAALLFGHLLDADEVLAFAPQTFLDPVLRRRHWDRRFEWAYDPLVAGGYLDFRYADLRPILEGAEPGQTTFHIHYARNARTDIAHASHIAGLPGVRLHEYDEGGHHLVKVLRDSGGLEELLVSSLSALGPPR